MSESEKDVSELPSSELPPSEYTAKLLGSSDESPFPLDDGDEVSDLESKIEDENFGDVQKPVPCDAESRTSLAEVRRVDSLESEPSEADVLFLSEQQAKCLKNLKTVEGIPTEIIDEVDSVFKQYHEAVTQKTTKRVTSEEKIWWKLEDADIDDGDDDVEKPKATKLSKQMSFKEKSTRGDWEGTTEFEELIKENQRLQDEREILLQRISDLEMDVDKIQIGDEAEMKEKTVSSYVKEVGKLKRDLDVLENKLHHYEKEKKDLEVKLEEKDKEFAEMAEMVQRFKDDTLKHESKRKVVEADIEKADAVVEQLRVTFNNQQSKFLKTVEQLSLKDDENLELKKAVKGFHNQQRCMSNYILELRDRLEFFSKGFIQLEEQNSKLKQLSSRQNAFLEEMKQKSLNMDSLESKWATRLEIVNKKLRASNNKTKKLADELMLKTKEVYIAEEEKQKLSKKVKDSEREKEEALDKIHHLAEIISAKTIQSEGQLKTISKLNFECVSLNKNIKDLQHALDELTKQHNKCHSTIRKVESENEFLTASLQKTVQHLLQAEKDVEKKEREVRDMVADYNNVLLEKNTLRSRLLQTHGRAKDYEFKTKYLNSVIAYDKQKLDRSDDLSKSLQYKCQKLQYDYNSLKIAFKEGKLQIRKLHDDVNSREKERGNLDKLLTKGEHIRITVIRDAERLRQDVSILKTVIQRRNAEISLAYEKGELMNAILNSNKNEMNRRLLDIHLLKTEVLKLRAENKMLVKAVENNVKLKNEIHLLQKDLTQAKQKCCALEEQMENPINVHRWRILKGKDPEKSDLLNENQTLRKKLLLSQNKYTDLKENFRTLENTYNNLRDTVKKTPEDLNMIHKLNEAQRIIKNKNKEIQRLEVTLRSYQLNTKEIQKDIEKKKIKADECMKKYYDLKRIHDRAIINKTDDELLNKLPFEKTCFSESKEELFKRILQKEPTSKTYEGTGLPVPKTNKKNCY